jgi:hypothetical protein
MRNDFLKKAAVLVLSRQAVFMAGWFGGEIAQRSSRHWGRWKYGEDFLQNTFHFPAFSDLPEEYDLEDGYWKEDHNGVFKPSCTWFFMAEITDDGTAQISFLRNKIDVRDRAGQEYLVAFYPEDGYLDFKTLKKGSTILVTSAQKHDFMDGSSGLRIEHLDSVSVIPCNMSDLMILSKLYHENKYTKCWCCGMEETVLRRDTSLIETSSAVVSVEELKKCAACRMARYCSRDCQKKDWKEWHKRTCKAVPIFQKLASINYRKYDERAYLSLYHALPEVNVVS